MPGEGDFIEQHRARYWDSTVNIFFDNGGRPLAEDVPIHTQVWELGSIPSDIIQVAVYGGDGLCASFPWTGAAEVNGFEPPANWIRWPYGPRSPAGHGLLCIKLSTWNV